MRLCNNAILARFLVAAGLRFTRAAAPAAASPRRRRSRPLTVDTDPVRSPDAVAPAPSSGPLKKEGEGYLLHTDVEEVVLNATVLNGTNWSRTSPRTISPFTKTE